MAPDRGSKNEQKSGGREPGSSHDTGLVEQEGQAGEQMNIHVSRAQSETRKFLSEQAEHGRSFTLRGTAVGLIIGVVICFSNTYFGLQTGWVSGMSMPSVLVSFAFFRSVKRYIQYPFTPVENVLVTTVAGAVGTMPLGCGFVGIMPALNYLLTPQENGPLTIRTDKLIIWALGLSFFGVVIAVPLRKQVIIREKLKFPSGTAAALLISVLHAKNKRTEGIKDEDYLEDFRRRSQDSPGLRTDGLVSVVSREPVESEGQSSDMDQREDWKHRVKSLLIAFATSATYVGFESIAFKQEPNVWRLLFNISYLNYGTFQSLACIWPRIGYGRLTLRLRMLDKVRTK